MQRLIYILHSARNLLAIYVVMLTLDFSHQLQARKTALPLNHTRNCPINLPTRNQMTGVSTLDPKHKYVQYLMPSRDLPKKALPA